MGFGTNSLFDIGGCKSEVGFETPAVPVLDIEHRIVK
jgi:hypothetical protein